MKRVLLWHRPKVHIIWPMETKNVTLQHKRQVLKYDGAIGDTIRSIREREGLRQSEVARGFRCHQPEISKLEAGQRSLKVSELGMLADALGMSLDELVSQLVEALSKTEVD